MAIDTITKNRPVRKVITSDNSTEVLSTCNYSSWPFHWVHLAFTYIHFVHVTDFSPSVAIVHHPNNTI